MSTQRLGADEIIYSDKTGGTVRNNSPVISSLTPRPALALQGMAPLPGNEIVLNGVRYGIVKQIARSGEAEVFLVSNNGNHFVFKYYYTQFKPKDEILEKLKTLRHPYIIVLFDYGYYKDRFYEISEYAPGGTLADNMPLDSLQKTKEIIAQAIEGMNYCHSQGIIHRDIKPENIFYRTAQKKEMAIGDFGISSNLKEGEELVRTTMARTSLYAAPELFTNIQGKTTIEKSVDYYALGMSMLHMWFGRDPFEDVDEFGIMRLKSEGRILFPDNINDEAEKLIKGLITVNPRERWGYEETKKWLNGDDVRVFYRTIRFDYKPYVFGFIDGEQLVVNNPKDLINYLEKYPEKGEGHLYRNSIAKWIEPVDPGLFNDLMDVVEKDYPLDRAAGLTKAIYILDQERPFRSADKTKLRTQEEIAAHFEQNFDYYEKDLQNPNAAFYIFLESRNYKRNADEYRNYFKLAAPEAALNTIIFKLEGADKFLIGDYTIYQPEELLQVDDKTLPLVLAQLSNINSKLCIWINSFQNLQPSLEKWHLLKRYDGITLRYALQQGFSFNGTVVAAVPDFYQLLKDNINSFFPDDGNSRNRDEAAYWLKHYMDAPLCRMVIDYLCKENLPDKTWVQLLDYALGNYEESGVNLYPLVEFLLPYIKGKITGNKILWGNIIDICSQNISKYWDRESKASSLLLLGVLKDYASFTEKNSESYPELYAGIALKSDARIKAGIRADIDLIKGDDGQLLSYRSDLGNLLGRFKKLGIDLPYTKRFDNENILLDKYKQDIKQTNEREKKEKIKITEGQFDKLRDKYRDKYKHIAKYGENEKLWWYIAFALTGIALLIVLAIDNESPVSVIDLAVIVLSALLGSRIGSIIGSRIAGTYGDKNAIGGIAGLYAGLLLGNHYKDFIINFISKEKALKGFGLYNLVPLDILHWFAVAMFVIFGAMALFFIGKRKKEINKINLKPAEQDALAQNLSDIDVHFTGKESFEVSQELVRVITLDDPQFDKEFAKAKMN